MKEMTCIVCPNGCRLKVEVADGNYVVDGNLCKRGISFAVQEIEDPRRSLCTTVKTVFKEIPRLSVRTDGEIKKEMLPLLMNSLRKVEITELLDIGAVILTDVLGSGVNVIATASLRQQMAYVKR
ncbi:MAG TPA: DUF1667 domain-containing protein [Thermotogota bacterium]|nr:DUF1667 domain-containing protein [Thermotogota bacterium]HPJ89518.1 DUF1667 domain-containing protein [Thermotogota bacterium]HPR96603.1 DUF1667 domain-containing protein [Thermotogota bacterium]